VLVSDVGDIVDTTDVIPEPLGGNLVDGLERSMNARLSSVHVPDTAWLVKAGSAELAENGDAHKSGNSESFHLKGV